MAETKARDIGLDMEPPKDSCKDSNCPWHSTLPVRGKVILGRVRSAEMRKTIVIEWDYDQYVPKYERYERRKGRVAAHHPPCIKVKEGDLVHVAECRPLSKTKKFVVVENVTEKEE